MTAALSPDTPMEGRGELILLATDAMRARRRPLAVVLVWAWESLLALLLAWPIAGAVRHAYGEHPQGDAPLFYPGAHELLDLVDHTATLRADITAEAGILSLVAAIFGLLPLGALLASIAYATRDRRAPPTSQALALAARAFLPLLLLTVVTRVAQGVVLFVALLVTDAVSSAASGPFGDARAQQLWVLVMFVFVVALSGVGVAGDLSRASLIRDRRGFLQALRMGLRTMRRAKLVALWSWAWRAAAGLVPVAMGSVVADRLGGLGGFALFALFVVHQAIALSRVALRASWLAKSLRLVDGAHLAAKGVVGGPSSGPQPEPTLRADD